MGYVLPIENYQYQNYHQRVTQPKRDPYPIDQLYQVQLDMAYQKETEERETTELYNKQPLTMIAKLPEHSLSEVSEEVYTELTGAGKYVNKII